MAKRRPDDPEVELVERAGSEVVPVVEPPVVARLIVEIRSDGSQTIARGGLEDLTQGTKVAIEAQATSPMALAVALVRSMSSSLRQLPRRSAAQTVRAFLGRPKKS